MASFASFDVEQIWACRFPAENSLMDEYRGRRFALPPSTMGFALRAGFKGNIETGPGSEFRRNGEMRGSGTKQNTRPECSIAEKEHVLGATRGPAALSPLPASRRALTLRRARPSICTPVRAG